MLTTSIDPDGLQRMAFTEAGIFGGKPGMNSEGVGLAVNGMYSTADDWSRFQKPFHLRCYEVLRSKNIEEALGALAGTPRSCTANFILGHASSRAIDIELAPDSLRLIDPVDGVLVHANHLVDPKETGVSEPENPRRHLSEFRHSRMEKLLNEQKPLNVDIVQEILKDHDHQPQSLCRHRDDSLPASQHTITKTAMIMDLEERKMWVTNGQPCKAEFEEFALN
jgi:isopenicillin-N N-acyltransferase-like protein